MSSFAINDELHIFDTFRRSFYLVTPNESSFATIEETPDYVFEGSTYLTLLTIFDALLYVVKGKRYRVNDAITSNSTFVIYHTVSRLFTRPIELVAYTWIYNNYNLVDLPWNSPWTWFLMLIAYDLCFYWAHRAGHEVNLFWGAHQVHHSSESMNIPVSARFPTYELPYSMFNLPIALFVRPSIYFVHYNINQIVAVYSHMEHIPKLGPLDWIFATPSNHRVHHGRNRYAIDRNYGSFLIIWDRLFGTYQAEKDGEELHYGLVHPLKTFDPWEVQFCHYKHIARTFWQMEGWKNKLSVLFKGPGWAPGKPRLGLPEDIPELPPKRTFVYDPQVSRYAQAYACAHFLVASYLCQNLIDHRESWPTSLLCFVTLINLASLTTIAKIFDAKQNAWLLEFLRCVVTGIALFYWRSTESSDEIASLLLNLAVLHVFCAVIVALYLFGSASSWNAKSPNTPLKTAIVPNDTECSAAKRE